MNRLDAPLLCGVEARPLIYHNLMVLNFVKGTKRDSGEVRRSVTCLTGNGRAVWIGFLLINLPALVKS